MSAHWSLVACCLRVRNHWWMPLGEMWTALGGEDIRAAFISASVLEIEIEGTTRLVEHVDLPVLLAFVADAQPPQFGADMRVSKQQVGDIADTAPGPIAQGKDR